eukprot:c22058_g1_i1 orf=65-583(+)
MTTFHCIKPLCLFLCCSVTLGLLFLLTCTTIHPPLVQQGDAHLHDLLRQVLDEADGVAKQDGVEQTPSADAIIPSLRVSLRKLASSPVNVDLANYNHKYQHGKLQNAVARRLLLVHSADEHHEMSTSTTATITTNGVAKMVANLHDRHHNVDESSAFHVDYSVPQTHPPKNN